MALRIALAGIYHESNTFSQFPTTLDRFREKNWLKGQQIIDVFRNAHHEISGMLEVLEEEEIEVVPILFAEATPGGTITADAYSALRSELLSGLDKVLPVDGCLVVPHGAAVAEGTLDMDGDWLRCIREKVGNRVPVVGTLDPHANVSRQMAASTDGLIAYKTNPHVDQRETGREAARLMVRILRGQVKPVQHFVELPIAISIEQQNTASEPCKSLYERARTLSAHPDILSISILLGFPYADVAEMGSSLLVITNGESEMGDVAGTRLREYLVTERHRFVGVRKDIDEALAEVPSAKKPVLLLDMGDNVGGGAPGNSVQLLNAIERKGGIKAFVCLYDPFTVARMRNRAVGDTVDIAIVTGPDTSANYASQAKLLALKHGRFKEASPRHGGQVEYDMGMTAVVETKKGSVVMITSLRVMPFSLQQLLSFDIDPGDFDVLVAKGVNAPIAAYGPVCNTIIQVDTPGITQADMTRFEFRRRRKPLFPFDDLESFEA